MLLPPVATLVISPVLSRHILAEPTWAAMLPSGSQAILREGAGMHWAAAGTGPSRSLPQVPVPVAPRAHARPPDLAFVQSVRLIRRHQVPWLQPTAHRRLISCLEDDRDPGRCALPFSITNTDGVTERASLSSPATRLRSRDLPARTRRRSENGHGARLATSGSGRCLRSIVPRPSVRLSVPAQEPFATGWYSEEGG